MTINFEDIDYDKDIQSWHGNTIFEDLYVSGKLFYDGSYGTLSADEGIFGDIRIGIGTTNSKSGKEIKYSRIVTKTDDLFLTSTTKRVGINCHDHWTFPLNGLTNSDNKPQATLDIEGNVLINDGGARGEIGGTGSNMTRGGFPHDKSLLHVHGARERGDGMQAGQVGFDNTVQVTISTGCIEGGGQGYLGRLNFGSSDLPAMGDQTTTEYDWACAAIASNAAGEDISTTESQGNLEFWTKNSSTAITKHFVIAVDGSLTATDTSIGSISDGRLKKNVEDFTYDVDKFKQLKTRTFDWKHPELHGEKSEVRGFIAQEIETVDPKLMDTIEVNSDTPDYQYLEDGISKTSKLGEKDAMYISVIQQLIAKIETLETKVAALES